MPSMAVLKVMPYSALALVQAEVESVSKNQDGKASLRKAARELLIGLEFSGRRHSL